MAIKVQMKLCRYIIIQAFLINLRGDDKVTMKLCRYIIQTFLIYLREDGKVTKRELCRYIIIQTFFIINLRGRWGGKRNHKNL